MKRLLLLIPLAALACTKAEAPEPAKAAAAKAPVEKAAAPAAAEAKAPLAEGDSAPELTLKLHDGGTFALAEHTEDFVFVYFYPKDDTPGCTVEAKGLRDSYEDLTAAGVKVIGVSLQDADSHKAFIDKYALPFPLAVDGAAVAKAFDVPVNGEYAARHSFLLKGGKVVKAWRKVVPAEHAAEVLAAAKAGE